MRRCRRDCWSRYPEPSDVSASRTAWSGRRCTRASRRLGGSACTAGRERCWRSCTDRTWNRTSRSWPTTSSRPPEGGRGEGGGLRPPGRRPGRRRARIRGGGPSVPDGAPGLRHAGLLGPRGPWRAPDRPGGRAGPHGGAVERSGDVPVGRRHRPENRGGWHARTSGARLRVRLLTRLACALRSSPDREHAAALSQQAVDLARRLGDPLTLGYALSGRYGAIWWPENTQERLEIASEVVRIATEVHDGELMVEAHLSRYAALADRGAMGQAREELAALARIAEELRQPAQQWISWAIRCQLALFEGKYEAAEVLIPLGLEADQPATPIRDNVAGARCHLFMLRREQGRVGEVEDDIRASLVEFPWYPLNRAALACLLLDLRRSDEARTVFEDLARNDFEALYRDNEWLLGMSLASEACSLLGDAASAAILYDQLVPFAGRQAIGFGEGSVGAVDRYLGLLATTMGRLDDAERHLAEGIEMNERMGSRPWAAHTRHDLARMLLARDGPGDRDRAEELLG